jgi:hypothetical protein
MGLGGLEIDGICDLAKQSVIMSTRTLILSTYAVILSLSKGGL